MSTNISANVTYIPYCVAVIVIVLASKDILDGVTHSVNILCAGVCSNLPNLAHIIVLVLSDHIGFSQSP